MKKRIIVGLVVVSVALFGSLAFAGDDWQDGFAKALDQNNLSGAMTLAYNGQASPQAVYEALEAFGVDREEVGESIMLAEENTGEKCSTMCLFHELVCCPASPSGPNAALCAEAVSDCRCECGSDS